MTRKARQELIGIGALVGGLFLGLTLLPWHITGDWGERLGRLLWHSVGAGAVLIPFLGVGWALAAFDRLGTLSWLRAAALGAGLMLLLPYTIGVVGRVEMRFLPADYGLWTTSQKLIGRLPAWAGAGVVSALGTAGWRRSTRWGSGWCRRWRHSASAPRSWTAPWAPSSRASSSSPARASRSGASPRSPTIWRWRCGPSRCASSRRFRARRRWASRSPTPGRAWCRCAS